MNIGKENEAIEFKKTTSETKQGIISICSILNKHGSGILFFGIDDNGDIFGQQIGKDTLRSLSHDIASNIKPSFMYEIKDNKTADGKKFIEVTFSGSNQPYTAYDRYYLRFTDEDRIMDQYMVQEFFYAKRNDYSLWEDDNSEVSIDAVNDDFLKDYIYKGNEEKRIAYKYTDKKAVLAKLGLLYKNGNLNNAGKYLFSNLQPLHLKLANFAGTTRITILDLRIFEGNIFECISAGINYITNHIDWRVILDGSLQRKELPEVPLEALREIVVNAFTHGNYNGITDFEIDIYKDRVTIYSPGRFPKPYTPEDFAKGTLEPIPMNPKIAQILYLNKTIEKFSTGFERTFESCKVNNVHFSYMDTNEGFRFTFSRKIDNVNLMEKLSETDFAVLGQLTENNHYRSAEIAFKLIVSQKTILRSISKLKEYEYIRRIGGDKDGYWEILK
jgi:ATP-dependent DNA helicase RecG